jgi:nucleotide-binding universal stress UspA family protein
VHPRESLVTLDRIRACAEVLAGELTVVCVATHESGPQEGVARDAAILLHGEPAARICEYAHFMQADVIVMPVRFELDCSRLWRRSVTAEVLRLSQCPVQLVRADPDRPIQYDCRTVLSVVQLDGTDDAVLGRASEIASRTDSNLHLLHVLPPIDEGLLSSGVDGRDVPLSRPAALERMQRLCLSNQTPVMHVRTGSLYREIAKAARETEADLIVMQHNLWTPQASDVRSVARCVVCPVLSVPVRQIPRNGWRSF